ncbi:MAG: hypothetical protein HY453_01420 [Parcubacteria group bacterium]|nr:hypothetical protein [Parcubacteria group bacterium]
MIHSRFFKNLKDEHSVKQLERQVIIEKSGDALRNAKKSIFALQRNDRVSAKKLLISSEKTLSDVQKKYGSDSLTLMDCGAYRAAVEEYIEARFFYDVDNGEDIAELKNLSADADDYLGGICDMTGEMVRRAILEATAGRFDKVLHIQKVLTDILGELIHFDMTGKLRTKYDDAKRNLRKIESIVYDISMKNRSS